MIYIQRVKSKVNNVLILKVKYSNKSLNDMILDYYFTKQL